MTEPSQGRALPPIWNVPFNRNPNFVGRQKMLGDLFNALRAIDASGRVQAIHGLGGVGKTQLAIEYAYRHAADYAIVWWVRSDEPATLAADYMRLAVRLGHEVPENASVPVVRDAIRRLLDERSDWLLVFDDAWGPEAIEPYLPQSRSGHVLATSRNPNWLNVAQTLEISVLARPESVAFLRKRSGRTDDGAAGRLAQLLGDLPLALEQAAACIEQANISFTEYVRRFQSHNFQLLQRGRPGHEYPATVATTWEISFRDVRELSPAAADLLNLCAFLAAEEIPRDMLGRSASHLPADLGAALADPVRLDEAISTLRLYSLAGAKDQLLCLHPLVGAVTRDRLMPEAARTWAEAAVNVVARAFPFDSADLGTWAQCESLLPHALAATSHAQRFEVVSETAAGLLNRVGRYLLRRAHFAEARSAFESALKIEEAIFGPGDRRVAGVLNNLGRVFTRLSDLPEAQKLYQRALEIDQRVYGEDHPNVAVVVNNLGMVLQAAGDYAAARTHFEWALSVYEANYGANDPKVASIVNNLGYVLRATGDLAGARERFERAMAIETATYGPDHPNVASILNNLGGVLRMMGELPAARDHFERALAIAQAAHGENHPLVATILSSLGTLRLALGELTDARQYFERSLTTHRGVFGQEHPEVARGLNNLAMVFEAKGETPAAGRCRAQAERILQKFQHQALPVLTQPAFWSIDEGPDDEVRIEV